MLDASQDADFDNLKYDFPDDFEFNLPGPGLSQDACDLPTNGNTGSTFTSASLSGSKGKGKMSYQDEGMSSSRSLLSKF
jgi:hypothetical protein